MSALFLKLVNTSISASWFILAALVLRLGLRKAPKWVSVALWGLVAVRLVCPVTLESALSLIPSAQTIPLDIAMDTTPAIQSGVPVINQVVNPAIVGSNTPAPGASVNPLQITVAVLANVWALGAAAMLVYTAVSYIRLRRRVFAAVRLRDHIYQSEAVTSPFVLGLFAPKIYLPFRMEEGDMAHVIAHEQAHIRRRDHWWKPLGFALLSVHWFNPLMWLAYILLCRDIELACDEKVIQALEHDARADYSQALLSCAADRRLIAACPLAFGEVGVKERVKSVLSYKKPAFWLVVLAVAACAAAGVCFLTDPVTPLEAQGRITGYGISADPVSGRESYHVRVEDLELDCTKEQHLDVVTYMGYVREGVIVERGTHDELYAANGVYRHLCDMQKTD